MRAKGTTKTILTQIGWGFTLKGEDDFKLEKFNAESPHDNFELTYGADDTGDVTKNDNLKHLSETIDKGTDGRGVALLMADGVSLFNTH